MAQQFKVSVLMPVYNDKKYVEEAIQSIVNQTYGHWELVVIDDGSTEETHLELSRLAALDPRIRVIRLAQNGGVATALNNGLKHVSGDFVARMDSDDVALPDRFKRQVDFLVANPSIQLVGGTVKIFGENVESRIVLPPLSSGEIAVSMFFNCCLVHPSVMFRRDSFLYPTSAPSAEDYALWLSLCSERGYRMANLPAPPILNLRKHASNVSKTYRSVQSDSSVKALAATLRKLSPQLSETDCKSVSLLFLSQSSVSNAAEVELLIRVLQGVEAALLRAYSLKEDQVKIREEVSKRMGAIATNSLRYYANPSDSPAWRTWLSRNPANQLTQLLALLAPAASPPPPQPSTFNTSKVTVICFSKDRAFQLKEYLRTLFACVTGAELQVHVLFKASPPFARSYQRLLTLFPQVDWVEETNFGSQLQLLVEKAADFILWGVDDVLFFDRVDIKPALERLQKPEIISASLRLAPSVTFCHPSNSVSRPPLKFVELDLAADPKWLEFDRFEGTQDWDYPFELCATIFRKNDIQSILKDIISINGVEGISHPNKLEVCGSRLFGKKSAAARYSGLSQCLCLSRLVMSVVTINRVQDVCENPIYAEHDLAALDLWFWEGKEFSEAQYLARSNSFNSVHIGEVYLKGSE